MPKRSFDEKMKYYFQKMEKLKDKHRRKRRRLDSFSSSDEEKIDNVQGKCKGVSKIIFSLKNRTNTVQFESTFCYDDLP